MSNVRRATDGQPRLRPLVEGGGGPAGAAPALAAGDLRLGSWAPRIPPPQAQQESDPKHVQRWK